MRTPPPVAREAFVDKLAIEVDGARQRGEFLGLLLVDLHNLARINHLAGYAEGDSLLCRTHDELKGLSKLPDTVFRVAGHGFAFILPALQNPGFLALAVHRVQQVLFGALQDEDARDPVQLRIGMAVAGPEKYAWDDLLATAEKNLQHSRLVGTVVMGELLEAPAEVPAIPALERYFAEALHNNAFDLHFQPKVGLLGGQISGAEALLRWDIEGKGAVPPDQLVVLAEAEGKLYEVSKWVIHRALRQLNQWGERYCHGISVNLPARMVNHPDLVNTLRDALRIWGIPPARLTLEITEDAVIEDKDAGFQVLNELSELGVGLSIDDFGTGYSSLSYFQHIPADELKIDRSFVSRMQVQPRERELVRIIIEIAHLFDFHVVAEGVEDAETLGALAELGCDSVQGYYFARPMPAAEFIDWLQKRSDGVPLR
ncbi:putative bifunctional diguanylate cyclase/phosphodiesterase [Parahaliea aestuarii]|uniref:EAL domain-containing protein n=1 Tax=Parahaliea aestuarii TaxID=1852021 RepID=A0A5C8ZMV3_9GAMM|nr:GGDEF domain-containing phosphodiesterase [Parahaliea aestuarii]TXS89092.1 EAL domain-containing protein [Parahaliea aestuarii]